MNNEQIKNLTLVTLDESYLAQMEELFKKSFAGEPWNDDWSDAEQLEQYIKEVSGGYNALNFGLVRDKKLVALAVGSIRHWWEGANYNIEELCVSTDLQGQGVGSYFMKLIEDEARARGLAGIFLQTDIDKPSFKFYQKNGFNNLEKHVSLFKSVKNG